MFRGRTKRTGHLRRRPWLHVTFQVTSLVTSLVTFLVTFLALEGCGGLLASDPTGSADTPEVTLEQFIPQMTEAVCSNLEPCCSTLGKKATRTCANSIDALWTPLFDHAKSIYAAYDPAQAARCISAYKQAWTHCKDLKVERFPLAQACRSLLTAPAPLAGQGAACEYSVDCSRSESQESLCVTLSLRSGFCQTQIEAHLGDACVSTTREVAIHCPRDTICSSDGHCRPRYALGTACGEASSDDCEFGAVCDAQGTGLCVPAHPSGSYCDRPNQCDNYACLGQICYPTLEPQMESSLFCE